MYANWEVAFLDDEDEEIVNYLLKSHQNSSAKLHKKKRGGSHLGRSPNIDRDFEAGHSRIYNDYFSNSPVYTDAMFERRFRMRRDAFLEVMNVVLSHDPYFEERANYARKVGLSTLQNCTAAIRMLGYGFAADSVDEYCRIAESTALEILKRFSRAIVESDFGKAYLSEPTKDDIDRIVNFNETRRFRGMFGSLDCMHWEWKNCHK